MNKDRIVGVAIFGGAGLLLLALGAVRALTVPGFRLWDALAGFAFGIGIACALFGWSYVRRYSGLEYLIARMRSR